MSRQFPPRLMQADQAAYYMGISLSKFRKKNIPRKQDGRNRLWELADLDDYADRLPYEGKGPHDEKRSRWEGDDPDDAFGLDDA